jgi:hypothetical protein
MRITMRACGAKTHCNNHPGGLLWRSGILPRRRKTKMLKALAAAALLAALTTAPALASTTGDAWLALDEQCLLANAAHSAPQIAQSCYAEGVMLEKMLPTADNMPGRRTAVLNQGAQCFAQVAVADIFLHNEVASKAAALRAAAFLKKKDDQDDALAQFTQMLGAIAYAHSLEKK